jgi:hypothetical protein
MSGEPVKFEVLTGQGYYAFLHQPDKGNVKYRIGPSYKIDLVVDAESKKKAEALGLKVKKATEKIPGDYVSIRSKVDPNKPDRAPPKVMDSKRNAIPKEILVGNGSEVRVRILPFKYGEGLITPILKEVMVTKLVKYQPTAEEVERKGTFLSEVENGFTVDSAI